MRLSNVGRCVGTTLDRIIREVLSKEMILFWNPWGRREFTVFKEQQGRWSGYRRALRENGVQDDVEKESMGQLM